MSDEPRPIFSADDQKTWRTILNKHQQTRDRQICDIYLEGLKILGINENAIPDLTEINKILLSRSGFKGRYVRGLEDGKSFYHMLAEKTFPVGNFIRSGSDLGYTPAPDVVHDLYGHLPFFTDKAYGDFCYRFGQEAIHFSDDPEKFRQFERFFWFTIEFGLIKTKKGLRVFGAGIASSIGECEYALSGKPEIVPFDVDAIRQQEFRIDIMQSKLFCLESVEQLYSSLGELRRKVENDKN